MEGWMNERMDGRINGVDVWMDRMDECMDERMIGWMKRWMGWMGGRMDGQMNGWVDRLAGWMDG